MLYITLISRKVFELFSNRSYGTILRIYLQQSNESIDFVPIASILESFPASWAPLLAPLDAQLADDVTVQGIFHKLTSPVGTATLAHDGAEGRPAGSKTRLSGVR